jgi:hypothetical protein
MKTMIRFIIPLFCFASAAYTSTAVTKLLLDKPDVFRDASNADGKYVNLLFVLNAPEDRDTYGGQYDWGYWQGTARGSYTDLKPGFWVYVYPNWYVWEKRAEEIGLDARASVQGKYLVLLHVVKAPDDENSYGEFYDYGFSEEYSYAGYDNLTPGYWVYMAPFWYVWAQTSDNVGGT